jgi:DNA modification methylase
MPLPLSLVRLVSKMQPYYQSKYVTILHGNCLDTNLKGITGIVTDPPYELSFMGKKWDGTGISFQQDTWKILRECCKPGAMLLSFGGSRTFHRIAVAIEDAGWEFRDTIMWVYGSGFPKSRDIGKDMEKLAVGGIKNLEVIGSKQGIKVETGTQGYSYNKEYVAGKSMGGRQISGDIPIYKINNSWEGYGTALKPAFEPILVCMNPLDGTFANNALKHGVAGLNIDECRVPTDDKPRIGNTERSDCTQTAYGTGWQKSGTTPPQGRFPANFIHDGSQEVMDLFPDTKSGSGIKKQASGSANSIFNINKVNGVYCEGSEGSAGRFFYCAKASKSERGEENNHPTVKPLSLMEYLVKLISPPKDALILDPFMGSGTTLMACKQLGIKCIGIELDESSCEIAAKRCGHK